MPSLGMDRKRPASGWRAATFAAALFAITLNFLQPLAHAALMRDGGPMAVSLWTSMCTPSTGQDDAQDSMPAAGKMHECCLGLAHAPTLAALWQLRVFAKKTHEPRLLALDL